ncbi:MAG: transposase, partial [Planctomycetota bacterium]
IVKRVQLILEHGWSNKEAKRLLKRLNRHQDELFTFLHNEDVPYDNNFGERSIRGAVIMRKNSYNNRSERGAMTQSVLMSVFFTIKQRGLNPVDTVKKALNPSSTVANRKVCVRMQFLVLLVFLRPEFYYTSVLLHCPYLPELITNLHQIPQAQAGIGRDSVQGQQYNHRSFR